MFDECSFFVVAAEDGFESALVILLGYPAQRSPRANCRMRPYARCESPQINHYLTANPAAAAAAAAPID